MTRIIDLENVTEVLLPDGTWNKVRKGSFKVDGYVNAEEGECVRGKGLMLSMGRHGSMQKLKRVSPVPLIQSQELNTFDEKTIFTKIDSQ